MSEAPELLPCPWGCKPKHGLAKGQHDMHGELNQNYAVWCEHARITVADRERAFGIWNARTDLPATDAQALDNPKVQALAAALGVFANIGVGSDPDYQPEIRMDRAAIITARAALAALGKEPTT